MNLKRSQVITFVVLASLFFWRGIWVSWNDVHGDFPNYYLAAKLYNEGHPAEYFYDDQWFDKKLTEHGFNSGRFSQFPPLTVFVMTPLVNFEAATAKNIWIIVNLVALGMIVFWLMRLFHQSFLTSGILVLASGFGLINNFRAGQLYIILLLICMGSYMLLKYNRNILTGLLLGLAAMIKYFTAIFIPFLLLQRRYKAVSAMGISIIVCMIIQILVFGYTLNASFFRNIFLNHLAAEIPSGTPYAIAYQAWTGVLHYLFVFHPDYNANPLLDLPILAHVIKYLLHGIIFVTTVVVLFKLYKSRCEHRDDKMLVVIWLAIFTLLPASATYHFVLLVFPLAFIFFQNWFSARAKLAAGCLYLMISYFPIHQIITLKPDGLWAALGYPRLYATTALFALTIHQAWYSVESLYSNSEPRYKT
ncbi:DUF2029 domain-containing protein [bacterium]|nr:DUF2029 domain-containing protein [bacterium]NUN46745.1 DUF2029 domain-containing protein [bacterium]